MQVPYDPGSLEYRQSRLLLSTPAHSTRFRACRMHNMRFDLDRYSDILTAEGVVQSIQPHIRADYRVVVLSQSRQHRARIMRTHTSPPKSRLAEGPPRCWRMNLPILLY